MRHHSRLALVLLGAMALFTLGACVSSPAEAPPEPPQAAEATQAAAAQTREAPEPATPPEPQFTEIEITGVPLEEVMAPLPGLRLQYRVSDPTGTAPDTVYLVLQPSRTARADISVHGRGVEGYAIMTETDTLWEPADTRIDSAVAAVLAGLPWPLFLPQGDRRFRATAKSTTIEVFPASDLDPAWQVRYVAAERTDSPSSPEFAASAVRSIDRFEVEPGALPGGGPRTVSFTTAEGATVALELEGAAVYRERQIEGVAVSTQGRPVRGIAVAPHPAVGLLPSSRVAYSNNVGRFVLPFRAAPGDWIRLYYGPVEGQGRSAVMVDPQEIRGRVGSPDFVTLIIGAD